MVIIFCFRWWYSSGWSWIVSRIDRNIKHVGTIFAVNVLLKTLFSPWKQITSPSSFQNFFQSAADNAISRMIGFVIRSAILFIALLWTAVMTICGVALVALWPFIPLAVIILPVLFARGVTL